MCDYNFIFLQDGNTPYSMALSNQQPGMADFVMAFASNTPEKQAEGPSQMTIFDMQVKHSSKTLGRAHTPNLYPG